MAFLSLMIAWRTCPSEVFSDASDEIASPETIRQLVRDAARQSADQRFSLPFLVSEWEEVADAWQLDSRRRGREQRGAGLRW